MRTFTHKEKLQLALALLGLLISIYLTINHYFSALPVYCPTVGIVDCGAVLASSFATILGIIPSSALGIVFFLVYIGLIWVNKDEDALYWNVIGFIFLFYFWYAEYTLGKICLYCTAIHLIVIALLASMLLGRKKG
ncbi:MAG: vitamin K epoxide reductase family protein [Candidatus Micrarchaeota archaeon]|nr:vitamin K epoxide reductase family protein [Candidatus Micrarchaeota archaeon]